MIQGKLTSKKFDEMGLMMNSKAHGTILTKITVKEPFNPKEKENQEGKLECVSAYLYWQGKGETLVV